MFKLDPSEPIILMGEEGTILTDDGDGRTQAVLGSRYEVIGTA